MTYIHAILLGCIEGITEFLPISSTGHMILAAKLFSIPQTEFVKSFEIFVQLAAILAVGILYIKTVINKPKVLIPVVSAFIPTAIVGAILYKFIKHVLLGNAWVTVISLGLGGVILLVLDKTRKTDPDMTMDRLTIPKAVIVGLCQSLSVIPGVSRSAATIVGGMSTGLSRSSAVEFSFLLSIPTMAAATLLDLVQTKFSFTSSEWTALAIGSIAAFVTAWVSVRLFLTYVKKHDFTVFAIYRIIIACLFAYFVLLR
jgi:undecaprenyl-diphosphatase